MKCIYLAASLLLLATEAFGQFAPNTSSTTNLGMATVTSLSVGGGAALQKGNQYGYRTAWGGNLIETHPGDLAAINWLADTSGVQTSGVWKGNSNNFFGISARMSRAEDPPNVTRATSAPTRSGVSTLRFASTAGITVGDYVTGSTAIPIASQVISKSGSSVEISLPAAADIPVATSLSFISPYITGTDMARGNRNALMVYALASDVTKPVNAIMTLAQCQNAGTYCSGGNVIAFASSKESVKLVGIEIDQMFPVGSSSSSVGAGSMGLAINTFNGSAHDGTGNGPAIQIGGIDGYWTNGYICTAVIGAGTCLGVGGGSQPVSSMADSYGGIFNLAAYAIGNDDGQNNQRIVFRSSSGPNAALFLDKTNTFNISAPNLVSLIAPQLQVSGTVRANGGYSANGVAGLTATKVVRNAQGDGTCTLEFTSGLLTGGTC